MNLVQKEFSYTEYYDEQREFARRDYEGLSENQIEELRKRRSDYASSLRKNYRKSMDNINKVVKDDTSKLTSRGSFTGGGLETSYAVESTLGRDIPQNKFGEFHSNSVRKELLNQSGQAKKLLRENVEKDIPFKVNKKNSIVDFTKNKETIKDLVLREGKDSKDAVRKGLSRNKKLAIGAATASGIAGLVYGGKKVYDHYKNKNKKEDK